MSENAHKFDPRELQNTNDTLPHQMMMHPTASNEGKPVPEMGTQSHSVVSDGEMFRVVSVCHACGEEGASTRNLIDGEDVTIVTFECTSCGCKADKMATSAFPEKGKRIVLSVRCAADLHRNVMKSRTASLEIPELELQLTPGMRSGTFTTVAGLLQNLKRDLAFLKAFTEKIDPLLTGEKHFTLILDDPLNGIYVQKLNIHLPPPENIDPRLEVTEYERTFEQDEELGIHDMKVEDYELSGDSPSAHHRQRSS